MVAQSEISQIGIDETVGQNKSSSEFGEQCKVIGGMFSRGEMIIDFAPYPIRRRSVQTSNSAFLRFVIHEFGTHPNEVK